MLRTFSVAAALSMSLGAGVTAAAQTAPLATLVDVAGTAQYGEWQPGPGWDRDIDVRCASLGYNYNMCQVDTGRGSRVYLRQQISKTRCIEGSNWGWNRAGVWVSGGCEGIFRVQRRWGPAPPPPPPGPWRPGPGWDQSISVRCASQGYSYNMCMVDTGRGSRVYVARQISNTPCVEGRTWGWNRAGIWVDAGCEAIFTLERRWR